MTPTALNAKLVSFYTQNARDLPWRRPEANGQFDPYKILVSEIMLQQTQVTRVIPKYTQFLKQFPAVKVLAQAPLSQVLRTWSGLGYNRRAKYLWQAAQAIVDKGNFPNTQHELVQLPGVGSNTAGAVLAYAFNQPVVFTETNIRSVFIHEFFPGQEKIADDTIRPLLEAALGKSSLDPRNFYWALMDYGSYLKMTIANPSRRSSHYAIQSAFTGSKRQIRGKVLRYLGTKSQSLGELQKQISDERLETVLSELLAELLIEKSGKKYQLYNS